MTDTASQPPLKVYWQPGCSSCLKTKEFLTEHGVPFQSVNVLADETGYQELAGLGLRTVPIVARGGDWANGQVLRDVARVAGVDWDGAPKLSPGELVGRLNGILSGAQRYAAQLPDASLETLLPERPRSYRALAFHIFEVAKAFVELTEGTPLTFQSYTRPVPDDLRTGPDIAAFGAEIQSQLNGWWETAATDTDFTAPADVYYGDVTLHEALERTAWHAGQHTRQLMLVLETIDIAPDGPLGTHDFAGLPMPKNVWDNELTFA